MIILSDPELAETVHGVGEGSLVTRTQDYAAFDHVSSMCTVKHIHAGNPFLSDSKLVTPPGHSAVTIIQLLVFHNQLT